MIIYIIIVFSLVLRLINLNQSLWLDEAAQAIESSGSLGSLGYIVADFMPPLFHILLHFWMSIFTNEVWMRLLSVFMGVGTIFFTYKIAQKIYSEQVGHISALLLTISPFHIYYSQELRPYSLATFVTTAGTYFLLTNNWVAYAVVAVLTVYSLYTAPFIFVAHGVYIFLKKRKAFLYWMKAISISLLSFVPWLPTFFQQLSGGSGLTHILPGWSEAVSISPVKAVALTLAKFMIGRVTIENKPLYAVTFLLMTIGILILWYRSIKVWKGTSAALTLFIAIPTALAFGISFFLPIIAPQRLLFTLPFFLLILASGLATFRYQSKIIILLGILLPNLFGLSQYYLNPRFQREQWRQATAFVEDQADTHTAVVFAFPEPFAPYLWYSKDKTHAIGIVKNFLVNQDDLQNLSLYVSNKTSIFFFQYLTDLTDPQKEIPKNLEANGFTLMKTIDFPGVGFVYEYRRGYNTTL